MVPLINLLWWLVYIVVLVGVFWIIFWAVDNIGQALPANVKTIVKVVISIIGLIILLTMLSGGGTPTPPILLK